MIDSNKTCPEAVALRTLTGLCSEILGDVQTAQSAACPAARELSESDPKGTEFLETAFSQGALLAGVARDQAEALVRALTSPVLTFAPWPIARNVLEASAIGAWLWEPSIGYQERIARSIAFRYEGLEQQVKAVRSNNKDISKSEARLERLAQQGKALGYRVIRDKKGKRIAVARLMPSSTDLVTMVLDAGVDYRLLSAVVHGHAWALMQLCLRDNGPVHSQIVGSKLRAFVSSIPRVAVVWACAVCGEAVHKIHQNRARLFGIGIEKLNRAFEQFHRQIEELKIANGGPSGAAEHQP